MKNKFKIAVLLTFLLTALVASAQNDNKNFNALIGSDPIVEINLGPMMLNLLSSATENEDDGNIASILSSLQGINVTVYEIDNSKNISSVRSELNNLSQLKQDTGYEKLAMVKEDDSLVYVLAKMSDGKFKSLSIFALDDDDELVLIDIKGDILMSQIGELMGHFDVDLDINGLDFNKHNKK